MTKTNRERSNWEEKLKRDQIEKKMNIWQRPKWGFCVNNIYSKQHKNIIR